MATVDDKGLIHPESGDTLRMAYVMRKRDYGAFDLGKPVIVINHATDSALGLGDNSADMIAIGKRVTNLTAFPYVAHLYLGRDGRAVQIIRANRAAPGTEGSSLWGGKKRQNNNLAFQIEWHNLGYTDLKGRKYGAGKTIRYQTDPRRTDLLRDGAELWQIPTPDQIRAAGEIMQALANAYGVAPLHCLHGHRELGGGHADPGPAIGKALGYIGREYLGLPEGFIVPALDYPRRRPKDLDALNVGG